jgi:uncharacterized protein (DUF1499 family)
VDDVEFRFDEATHTIHFRSAARSGHYDFGVNRKRMEDLRGMLEDKLWERCHSCSIGQQHH